MFEIFYVIKFKKTQTICWFIAFNKKSCNPNILELPKLMNML